MSNVIPFKAPDDKCSFCHKPKSAVKHLFGNGNGKFICNECLAHAIMLIAWLVLETTTHEGREYIATGVFFLCFVTLITWMVL